MPRYYSNYAEEMGFTIVKENFKYYAICHVCGRKLTNTAVARMRAHRGICHVGGESEILECNSSIDPENGLMLEEYIIYPPESKVSSNQQSAINDSPRVKVTSPTSAAAAASSTQLDSATGQKRKRSVIRFSSEEIEELNSRLSNFVFGCNIPFNVIDSDHFVNFVKGLHPAYAARMPESKDLETTLLDRKYSECLTSCKEKLESDSVLLIDGWKNTCDDNTKTIVTILHDTGGARAFINAWNYDLQDNTEDVKVFDNEGLRSLSKTNSKMNDIVLESIAQAKSLYETDVYAIVSDTVFDVSSITETIPIWHYNSSSHIGKLLVNDVLDIVVSQKVKMILQEFKTDEFEKALLDQGGCEIKVPCDKNCCSFRDSYNCLIQNVQIMKALIADDTRFEEIKPAIKALIFDNDFLYEVKENAKLLNPICNLIEVCEKPDTSIGVAVHLWLNLSFPAQFNKFYTELETRRDMIINIHTLTAYYLHPQFSAEASSVLSRENIQKVQEFLLDELTEEGINSLHEYQEKSNVFYTLFKKNINDPFVFWGMAKVHHPNLSHVALKLLKIPASSAQIEFLFSDWPHMYLSAIERMDFEKAAKLLHIYYTLKMF